MKILHIAEPFATGVLSFLVDITRKQVEEHEIYILWGQRPLTPDNVEKLFDSRIHLIKIDAFKGALGSVLNPKAYLSVRKWFNEIKPDMVHMHSSASGFVGRWALPVRKLPSFYTPHGYSFLMQDGGKLKRSLFWMLEWISAKCKCKTIACSEGEYKEAVKLSKNSDYVNNGINLDILKDYVRDWDSNKKIKVCTSGRILDQKNPILFNKIASLLPDVEFVWIGEGELKKELTSKNIKVTGWIDRQKALEIIRDSDVFILPSFYEGLPISLLEAMALKKLCIVSNVIGNRDVIKTGFNGIICNEAEEYASVIRKAIKGEIDCKTISENAAKDVFENYNLQTMASKYDAIYKSSLESFKSK